MDTQTLKRMWKDSGFAPQKRFGQNFLFSEHWLQKMILDLDFKRFETVTEIGPGVGALTLALIQAGAQQITVYEIDPRMVAFLDACQKKWNWPISIREQDAMTLTGIDGSLNPHLLIGNLPYNTRSCILCLPVLLPQRLRLNQPWWPSIQKRVQCHGRHWIVSHAWLFNRDESNCGITSLLSVLSWNPWRRKRDSLLKAGQRI